MTTPLRQYQAHLVSIIIPVYNRAQMLQEAVESALKQNYKPIEIIIIDDGSSDETSELAHSLAKRHSNVSCIRTENQGPALARQTGLEQARGAYIQYLDSDDLLDPNKLVQQVAELQATTSADVVYCRQALADSNGKIIEDNWMRTGEQHKTMFPAMLAGRIWGTPAPLYRHTLLDKAGAWKKLSNLEDWEYDCRLAIYSTGLAYVDQSLVLVRRHAGEHYGNIEPKDHHKIRDRAEAFILIAGHAKAASINHNSLEYRKFVRSCFHVARQTAHAGLIDQARALFTLCMAHRNASWTQQIEYRLFSLLSGLIGWQRMARISSKIDAIRGDN